MIYTLAITITMAITYLKVGINISKIKNNPLMTKVTTININSNAKLTITTLRTSKNIPPKIITMEELENEIKAINTGKSEDIYE